MTTQDRLSFRRDLQNGVLIDRMRKEGQLYLSAANQFQIGYTGIPSINLKLKDLDLPNRCYRGEQR